VVYYRGRHETIRDQRAVGDAASTRGRPAACRHVVSRGRTAGRGIPEFGRPMGASVSPRQAEGTACAPDSWSPMPPVIRAARAVEGGAASRRWGGRIRHRVMDAQAHRPGDPQAVRRAVQPGRRVGTPTPRPRVELAEAGTPGAAA